MDSREMLEWMWQPRPESPVTYLGQQCLSKEITNVLGFKGHDFEGIPWQLFFDAKSKQPMLGFSGEGNPESDGSTALSFSVENYKTVSAFNKVSKDFYPSECLNDYDFEGVPQ